MRWSGVSGGKEMVLLYRICPLRGVVNDPIGDLPDRIVNDPPALLVWGVVNDPGVELLLTFERASSCSKVGSG